MNWVDTFFFCSVYMYDRTMDSYVIVRDQIG